MAKKKGWLGLRGLSIFSSQFLLKNLLFLFFLGFLATVYIANAHYAERNVRRIQVLQRENKELRWYYMSLQADNMYNSKRSEVLRKVREEGLRPIEGKPKKIIVNKQ